MNMYKYFIFLCGIIIQNYVACSSKPLRPLPPIPLPKNIVNCQTTSALAQADESTNKYRASGYDDLMIAILKTDKEKFNKHMSVKGINVNAKTKTGKTPLIILAENELAIDADKGDKKKKDDREMMALKLIAKKANLDAQDESGATALMYAVLDSNYGLLNTLLEAGASPNIKDVVGRDANQYALDVNNQEAIAIFAKHKNKKFKGVSAPSSSAYAGKATADTSSSSSSSSSKMDVKLNKTADNTKTKAATAPIVTAAVPKIDTTMQTLPKDVNELDSKGRTPLMLAIERGDNPFAKELLKHAAKVNAIDSNGMTAAMYAWKNNNYEVLKVLIENGASWHIVNPLWKNDKNPQGRSLKQMIEDQRKQERRLSISSSVLPADRKEKDEIYKKWSAADMKSQLKATADEIQKRSSSASASSAAAAAAATEEPK